MNRTLVIPDDAVVDIACSVCDWDYGYVPDADELLKAWTWHLTDKQHLSALAAQ